MTEISGQLSLFSLMEPSKPSAARYVALTSSPYWTTSWDRIKAVQDNNIREITRVVKKEFCPYEYAGHYGSDGDYIGYVMRMKAITVMLAPAKDGQYSGGDVKVKWEDFAREVIDLIWKGERGNE